MCMPWGGLAYLSTIIVTLKVVSSIHKRRDILMVMLRFKGLKEITLCECLGEAWPI